MLTMDFAERLQALQTLAALPKVRMTTVVPAEAKVAKNVVVLAFEVARIRSERLLAYWSVFVLCFRNGEEVLDSLHFLETQTSSPSDTPLFQFCTGQLRDHDGLSLLISQCSIYLLFSASFTQWQSDVLRARFDKQFFGITMKTLLLPATAECTISHFTSFLPLLLPYCLLLLKS